MPTDEVPTDFGGWKRRAEDCAGGVLSQGDQTLLASSRQRGFWRSLHRALAGTAGGGARAWADERELCAALFGAETGRPFRHRIARLHLAVARAMSAAAETFRPADVDLQDLATPDEPTGFLRRLAEELHPGHLDSTITAPPPSRLIAETSLPIAFELTRFRSNRALPRESEGLVATLTLRLWSSGRGDFFREPALSFVERDPIVAVPAGAEPAPELWHEAEKNVRTLFTAAGLWPRDADISWSVAAQDGREFFSLEGDSAGAAFAMALARLLLAAGRIPDRAGLPAALRRLLGLQLADVLLLATCGPDGAFGAVGAELAKLRAALDRQGLPVSYVVVSAAQETDFRTTFPLDADRYAGLRYLFTPSLEDAAVTLSEQLGRDWRGLFDYAAELQRHREFHPRDWLDERVDQFLTARGAEAPAVPGYLLLLADPLFGKSALAAHRVGLGRGWPAVHFFKATNSSWADPLPGLRSMALQLCRRWRIEPPDETSFRHDPRETLRVLWAKVGTAARAAGGTQLVILDGLDESGAGLGRLLEALPQEVPPGLAVFVTSRAHPLPDFDWLRQAEHCTQVPLDPLGRTSREEIRSFLEARSRAEALLLPAHLLDVLADAAENLFGLAARLIAPSEHRDADLAAWLADPHKIPQGLAGWLKEEWARISRMAARENVPLGGVRLVLALAAVAGADLSRSQILALNNAAKRARLDPEELDPAALDAALLDRVLRLARGYFDPTPAGVREADAPLRFFHTTLPQFILGTLENVATDDPPLTREAIADARLVLAHACAELWRKVASPARDFALKNVARALGEAQLAGQRESLMFDFAYLSARYDAHGIHALLDDFPARLSGDLARLRLALDSRQHFLAVHADRAHGLLAQELRRVLLAESSGPLAALCSAVAVETRPWLSASNIADDRDPAELRRFEGHTREVWSVAFSPDGTRVLSGSADRTVRLWDAQSGRELRRFEGHSDVVCSVAFSSPDGTRVLSGSADRTVRLWDAQSGQELRRFEGHSDWVRSVAFSPDGTRVLSGSEDLTVRLWEAQSGQELHCFEGHSGSVQIVAFFSPDGTRVLSGSADRTVRLWEVQSGRELRRFKGHSGAVMSAAIPQDSSPVLSGSADKTVRLWDAQSERELRRFEGHTGGVTSVAFSPDGTIALSGSRDLTLRLWDVQSGRELCRFEGHAGWVQSVAFSPDGTRVLSGSRDHTIRLWNAQGGRGLHRFEGHADWVQSVAFSPDGTRVLSGSDDRTVRLSDARSGRELHRFEGHLHWVRSVAFSSDGTHLVSGSWDRTVRLWDVRSGRAVTRLRPNLWTSLLEEFDDWIHFSTVQSVAFSADGARVLSGSGDHTVRLWDTQRGQELRRFVGHYGVVCSVAFSADGTRVLSGSADKTVRLWDTQRGQELCCFEGHTGGVTSVAFSADGTRMLSGSRDHTVRLWDTQRGQEPRCFVGHYGTVCSVAFSADGARVLSGSTDHTVRLWDAQSGTCLGIWECTNPHGATFLDAHTIAVLSTGSDHCKILPHRFELRNF